VHKIVIKNLENEKNGNQINLARISIKQGLRVVFTGELIALLDPYRVFASNSQ